VNGAIQIDMNRCVDCGICATVCPTGAIEAQAPTNIELLAQIKTKIAENRSITFACAKYGKTTRASTNRIQVNCLGRLDESVLLAALVEGASSVNLIDAMCGDCPQAIGRQVVEQAVARTNALALALGIPAQIHLGTYCSPDPEPVSSSAVGEGVSRRVFFEHLMRETMKATVTTVTTILAEQETPPSPSLSKGKLPVRVPLNRRLLLTTMRKIKIPVTTEWSGGLWAQLQITEKCSGCQACVFFCPTGALIKIETPGQHGVSFRPAVCTGCGLCQMICYQKAVMLTPRINLAQVINGAEEKMTMPAIRAVDQKIEDLVQAAFKKT
jgi:ferredoxin